MNTGTYPIRVIFTRTAETSRKYLEQISASNPAIKIHSPAVLVEGPENSAFHLCAESGELKIFVIHTERGPYFNHPNVIYSMVKHFKAGIILYISGETLGIVKPSRFHNFVSIPMNQDTDAEAYFKAGIVGNTAKEIETSLAQKLQYLLSLEEREQKERTPKPGPRPRKSSVPKAPKKTNQKKKPAHKMNPRRLSYSDDESEEEKPRTVTAKAAKPAQAIPWGNLGN